MNSQIDNNYHQNLLRLLFSHSLNKAVEAIKDFGGVLPTDKAYIDEL